MSALAQAAKQLGEYVCVQVTSLIGSVSFGKLLEGHFKPEDIDFKKGTVRIVSDHPEVVVPRLMQHIGQQLRGAFGGQIFESVLEGAWKKAQKDTAPDVLVELLNLVPTEYLVEERVKYLSRENLESLALKKTEELRAINANLESTIQTRTEELTRTNEALKQSKANIELQLVAVATEKERIEAIVSSIGEGLLVTDSAGKVTLCNKTAQALLDRTEETIVGQHITSVFGADANPDSPLASLSEVLAAKKTITLSDALYIRPDKVELVLSITTTSIEFNKEIVGGVTVFRDITEQKILEAAKQQFISIAAHQLRTPLSGIKWALSLLLDAGGGELNDQQRVLVMKSSESVNRLIGLVNDLLDVDRIESGRIQFKFVPTDAMDLFRNVLFELTPQISHKQISLKILPPSNLPKVPVDQESMRAVFQNLLENAIRYTPPQGTITLAATADDHSVNLSITDTGIGIPFGEQKKIFTRFFRASNAVKREPNGSGLGLYIAKQIVDRHRGSLWFETTVGKGTTFHVSLPIHPEGL